MPFRRQSGDPTGFNAAPPPQQNVFTRPRPEADICRYTHWVFVIEISPMKNKLSDEEQQASLDKNFPFIEQNAELPGRWVPDTLSPIPGGKTWHGQKHWSTRHGDAVVRWGLGEPYRIDFALYPDQSRGVVQKNGYGRWRRLAKNARNWIHGTIQINTADVVFRDGEQLIYTPPQITSVPDLEADLAHDAGFLEALQDDGFADATYEILKRDHFYRSGLPGWRPGGASSARLVADLRGLGECFSDWHPWGGSRDETHLRSVLAHLAGMGWEAKQDQE